MVEVSNLTKCYEGRHTVCALQDVTFRVEKGEMVATVGPSGSGKSTLLNILGGLDRPTSGSVRIDNVETARLDDNALTRLRRTKIGFVFQFYNLLPTLTALENVALPLHLASHARKRAEDRADELLEMVGLAGRCDHLPDELSGGEQQRVAIARALALHPPLVLADEPTGNLDSKNGEEILSLLRGLQRQFTTTVIMVTHDPRAAHVCDRVLMLKDGQIVRQGA